MRNYTAIEAFVLDKLKKNLAPDLFYHGVHHTQDVLKAIELIAPGENISDNDLFLLKIAALYHDAGFILTYHEHERASCRLAQIDLPPFGLTDYEIAIICGMIIATKIPQAPVTQLEKIIADADLEYLGTKRFDKISNSLFKEAKVYLGVKTQQEWDKIQVKFMSQHHYFTQYCIKNREAQKEKNLQEVKARL